MEYSPGFAHHIRFGGYGEGVDAHGVCLYGDVNHATAQFACDAAGAIEHPDQAALADHQKVSFWFRFAEIRPYGKVQDTFDRVAALLEEKGWKVAPAIDGLPDTGSSIDNLVDTNAPGHWDKSEEDFPEEPGVQGYNAAGGFSIVVEKPGSKPYFTEDEVAELHQLALAAAQVVYDRELAEVE
ncbi:MAG: hypothetical protein Q8P73_00230 [bacterium]|nr:hypothetical protein [bacterium]